MIFLRLKYVITVVLSMLPISSALASSESVLEPVETGWIQHGGSFWCLLTDRSSSENLAVQI